MNTEEDELGVLDHFLGLFGAEVIPHAREELNEDQKKQLRQLSAGQLDDDERKTLIPLLAKNEVAMEYLAKLDDQQVES